MCHMAQTAAPCADAAAARTRDSQARPRSQSAAEWSHDYFSVVRQRGANTHLNPRTIDWSI